MAELAPAVQRAVACRIRVLRMKRLAEATASWSRAKGGYRRLGPPLENLQKAWIRRECTIFADGRQKYLNVFNVTCLRPPNFSKTFLGRIEGYQWFKAGKIWIRAVINDTKA